jgi:hypothetical protein
VHSDVRAALVREYVYAYSALSPWDARLDSLVLPDANTVCTNVFLEHIAAHYPAEFIVMVLDGAGWHRSHALEVPATWLCSRFRPMPPSSTRWN